MITPLQLAATQAAFNVEQTAINLSRFALIQEVVKAQEEARAIAFNWFHRDQDRAVAMSEIQFGDEILCRIAKFTDEQHGIST